MALPKYLSCITMSFIAMSSFDEFLGTSGLAQEQLLQLVDLEDDFWNEFSLPFRRLDQFESFSSTKSINESNSSVVNATSKKNTGSPQNSNNIEFFYYTYGDAREQNYQESNSEKSPEINGTNSPPFWQQGNISSGIINMLNNFDSELSEGLTAIEYQDEKIEQFEVFSNMPLSPKDLVENKAERKYIPTLHFNYDGVEINQEIVECNLINFAANPIPESKMDLILRKLNKRKKTEEKRVFSVNRTRYSRPNLESLSILHAYVQYQYNTQFCIEKPYEPEYIRVQINPTNNLPFNETRCGLCPYCPELVFKNLKTSTYAQHLSLTHGIQTDNYITPNPLLYGSYNLKKGNTNRKTKAHISEKNGVICPVCHDIVETECSKTTATRKPLNNYLRHFREKHRKYKEREDPIKFFSKYSANEFYEYL